MKHEFTIEVELESRTKPVEILVTATADWENDGIGPYEYWGQQCNDKGNDFVTINEIDWDSTGYTAEEIAEINEVIDDKTMDWEQVIAEAHPLVHIKEHDE